MSMALMMYVLILWFVVDVDYRSWCPLPTCSHTININTIEYNFQ